MLISTRGRYALRMLADLAEHPDDGNKRLIDIAGSTRNADQISVYDVLKVMEGELAPVACLAEDSRPCSRAGICRTLPLWSGLNEVVSGYLKKYTLQDLVHCEEDC